MKSWRIAKDKIPFQGDLEGVRRCLVRHECLGSTVTMYILTRFEVIQRAILRPFFKTLDQLFQDYDPAGPNKGVRVDKLGYADEVEVVMAEDSTDALSDRLPLGLFTLADAVIEYADMHVK